MCNEKFTGFGSEFGDFNELVMCGVSDPDFPVVTGLNERESKFWSVFGVLYSRIGVRDSMGQGDEG